MIGEEFVGVNTSKVKELISNSSHVKDYLGIPFHSIENLFSTVPEIKKEILRFSDEIMEEGAPDYRCVGSTYYDKPPGSYWELSFHQDLRVKLRGQIDDCEFRFWDKRGAYYEVQPPLEVLKNMIILRIHLDDMNITNGGLKIIPKSHKKGIVESLNSESENGIDVELKEGDVFLMSPLLLHSSTSNLSDQRRRVIHLEYSNIDLPWFEDYSECL